MTGAAGSPGWHLPHPLTPFVGRDHDLVACAALLQDREVRLVTLVGTGGVGKTRLALQVARMVADSFAQIAFASLTGIRDAALLPDTVAEALGFEPVPGRPLAELARDHLQDRLTLILLDNLEGVVAGTPWLATLLSHCPTLTVLATSRVRLGVYGEQIYTVPPLALPDPSAAPSSRAAAESDAVRLFESRARAVLPGFTVSDATVPVVADICRRLDGLPLAIELAAARSHVLSPPALRERLDARLSLLVGGPADLPTHHRTLRDAIGWSYDLLTPTERAVLRRLGVFAGSFSLDAAERVCEPSVGSEITRPAHGVLPQALLDTISALVDKSLIHVTSGHGTAPRFGMLETIREFGLEVLAAAGEATMAHAAHAQYYLARAEQAEPALTGAERGQWLARLRDERGNFRAALAWSLDAGEPEVALRLGAALWRFWVSEGSLREGREGLERALASDGDVAPAARAKALHYLGNLALDLGDHHRADARYEASLTLRRELDDRPGIAASLTGLGLVATAEGNYTRARQLHEEARSIQRALGDHHAEAVALHNLGQAALAVGDLVAAREWAERSLTIHRQTEDPVGVAYASWAMGEVARRQGKTDEARALLDAALTRFHQVDDRSGVAFALHGLARLAAAERDVHTAAARYSEALRLRAELGERVDMIECLEGLAALAVEQDDIERAIRWSSVAASERHVHHAPVPAVDLPAHTRSLDRMKATVGERRFQAAWAAGSLISLDEAVHEAAAVVSTIRERQDDTYGLTPRERDVLALLVEGRTDRDIAATLYMAPSTVSWHVKHILAKLDVESRTAAATLATRAGLVQN